MPKFGDIILNHYATGNNPTRYTLFIRYSGKHAQCINMDGHITNYDKKYVIKDPKFEVIDNIKIKEQFTKAVNKYLNNMDCTKK